MKFKESNLEAARNAVALVENQHRRVSRHVRNLLDYDLRIADELIMKDITSYTDNPTVTKPVVIHDFLYMHDKLSETRCSFNVKFYGLQEIFENYFDEMFNIFQDSGRNDFYPNLFSCKDGCNVGSLYINGRCIFRNTRIEEGIYPIYVNVGFAVNYADEIQLDTETARLGYIKIYMSQDQRSRFFASVEPILDMLVDSIDTGSLGGFEYD